MRRRQRLEDVAPAKEVRGHREQEETGRTCPYNLQGEHGWADTSIDFRPLRSKPCEKTFPCLSHQVHGNLWGQPQETHIPGHGARITDHRLSQGCEGQSGAGGWGVSAGVREGCEVHHKETGSIEAQGTDSWMVGRRPLCGLWRGGPVGLLTHGACPRVTGKSSGRTEGSGLGRGTLSAVCRKEEKDAGLQGDPG